MENTHMKKNILPAAFILAIGFIIAALIISGTWRKVAKGNVTISVTGSASKNIKSDLAIWDGTFYNESSSLTEAYTKLQESNKTVKNYLLSKGFADEQIKYSSITTTNLYESKSGTTPTYDYYSSSGPKSQSSGKIIGYRLSQQVSIESNDVDKIDKLSREATELINQGIAINSDPPRFMYTKIAELKIEMIGLATQDAKLRAEQIANSTDNKVGEVRSSRTGVFQINSKNSTEVSDYGINDVSSLEKTVTAVVNVSFSIE
ncbi:MAG: SIMPL domain-containing protein [Ignavibacteria bacterium]|nr:SIMPL domain-containing protein [Ignavibacteria bacterium]